MADDVKKHGSNKSSPEGSKNKNSYDTDISTSTGEEKPVQGLRDIYEIKRSMHVSSESMPSLLSKIESKNLLADYIFKSDSLKEALKGFSSSITASSIAGNLPAFHPLNETYKNILSVDSEIMRSISRGLISSDLTNLSKSLTATEFQTLDTKSEFSDALRQIAETSLSVSDITKSNAFLLNMRSVTSELTRLHSQVHSQVRPINRLLEDLHRQNDWLSHATRSITSILAASLLSAAPSVKMSPSTLDAAAWTSSAFNAAENRELWELARSESFIIDSVSILNEAEKSPTPEGIDVEELVDRLTKSISTAVSSYQQPAQKVSILQTIVIILTILIPLLQMVQSHIYHVEEIEKPDEGKEIVQKLEEHSAILRELVSKLEIQTADIPKVVALRNANIRAEPSASSKILAKLKQGDIAVFKSKAGKWTKVEVANALTNEVVSGWVYSKLTSRIIEAGNSNSPSSK